MLLRNTDLSGEPKAIQQLNN